MKIYRMAATFVVSLLLVGCSGGVLGGLGEGLCVADDADCLKMCRDNYESYREGMSRGEANQTFQACTDACGASNC